MSSTGALVHVPSACIGVHLPASALDACLLAPSHAAPACKVARSLPPQPEPIAPRDAGRDGGSDPPRRSSAATPHAQRYGLAGASKLPASAMRSAAKSPCTNSARRGDGGKRPPHKAPALGAGWSNAGRPVASRQRAHAPEPDGAVGSRAARRTHHYGRRGSAEAAGRASKTMEPPMHTDAHGWAGVRHARSEPNPTGSAW
jgi:hypothetical protein